MMHSEIEWKFRRGEDQFSNPCGREAWIFSGYNVHQEISELVKIQMVLIKDISDFILEEGK